MSSTDQRYALITGVSEGGLGDALVTEFLPRGINVIATALDLKLLDHIKDSRIGVEKLQLDVTSTKSIQAAVAETERITGGKLDFLINNAGYGYMMPILDADISEVKRNFDVNVFGLLEVTQAFFPLLRAAKGTIANQSSIAGQPGMCQPFIGSYSASKTALTDFSNTLRVELAPFDVKVVTLFTGDVGTRFWNPGHVQGSHRGLPESSPYALHKEHVEAMMRGETNPTAAYQQSRERWAKGIVDDLLRAKPPIAIRRGTLSTLMWLVSCLAPTLLLDLMFWHTAKLAEFQRALRNQGGKKTQ